MKLKAKLLTWLKKGTELHKNFSQWNFAHSQHLQRTCLWRSPPWNVQWQMSHVRRVPEIHITLSNGRIASQPVPGCVILRALRLILMDHFRSATWPFAQEPWGPSLRASSSERERQDSGLNHHSGGSDTAATWGSESTK